MASLIKNLIFKWDIWSRRYFFFLANEQKDIDACLTILEEVRRKELNRVSGQSVIDSSAFAGKSIDFVLGACRDEKTGQIIGCMRISKAWDVKDNPSSIEEYHLDHFKDELLEKLYIFTRLAVLKEYRRSPAAFVIMLNSFRHILKEGVQGDLMTCELSLLSMYNRMGLRPIGPKHNSPTGGYRIPMIFFPDYEYLQRINSPALPWAKHVDFDHYRPIQSWYNRIEEESGGIKTGATFYNYRLGKKQIHRIVTNGMSEAGESAFLKNALIIKCAKNDVLMAANDGGKAFGIVKKGRVKVVINGETIVTLKKGEIFGEMNYVLGTTRSADVISDRSGTQVILFSISSLNRVANDLDIAMIWKNLATILAKKLAKTNKLLVQDSPAELLSTTPHP